MVQSNVEIVIRVQQKCSTVKQQHRQTLMGPSLRFQERVCLRLVIYMETNLTQELTSGSAKRLSHVHIKKIIFEQISKYIYPQSTPICLNKDFLGKITLSKQYTTLTTYQPETCHMRTVPFRSALHLSLTHSVTVRLVSGRVCGYPVQVDIPDSTVSVFVP